MTKRDWAHLIGWGLLIFLLWDGRAFQILTLDSSKRVAKLEAENKLLVREVERLRDRADLLERGPEPGEWNTYKWYVDELRAERGADEPRSSHELDQARD